MPTSASPVLDTPFSIAPTGFASLSTQGKPNFLLSVPEWYTIQVYVSNGRTLPATEEAFKNSLGKGAPADLSIFKPLIDCYRDIKSHCEKWSSTTYPATVSLASTIYDYGKNKAPIYYGAIIKQADILTEDPGNERAKATLKGIFANLKQTAQDNSAKAKDVAAQVQEFLTQTQDHKKTLIGSDNKSGLRASYNNIYGDNGTKAQEYIKEIEDLRKVLDKATKEYDQAVVIASTTPTYAWIPYLGWIASAVIAGVYGKMATDALDRINATRAKIEASTNQLIAATNLSLSLENARIGLNNIADSLQAALPNLEKVNGAWKAIADDMGNIEAMIERDIFQVIPLMMSLGVEEAIVAWEALALKAESFRMNAYITLDQKSAAPH